MIDIQETRRNFQIAKDRGAPRHHIAPEKMLLILDELIKLRTFNPGLCGHDWKILPNNEGAPITQRERLKCKKCATVYDPSVSDTTEGEK